MKTKILHRLFAILISCVVIFGAVIQTSTTAFAADMQDDVSVAPIIEDENISVETPSAVETPVTEVNTVEMVPDTEDHSTEAPMQEDIETAANGKKYWVAFSANGGKFGTETTKKTKQTNGEKYALPANPAREGYTFKGWYTAKNGGSRITASSTVNLTESTRLYAQWNGKKYWVAFSANGGKFGTETTKKAKQTNGKKYILPANPVREGYTFNGWYSAKNGGSRITASSTVKVTKSTRLYAHWSTKAYWVVFDANGGKIGTAAAQKTKQTYLSQYSLPADPVREGYIFNGWYTAKSGGSQITAASTVKITKSTRLYAQWEAELQTTADFVIETKINVSGTGSGWHGKLVIQDGNVGISFGIQRDTHSGIGSRTQPYIMFESVRNNPAYHNYKGYRTVAPGWHTLRLEYYRSENKAIGYCDGEYIAEIYVQPLSASYLVISREAIPRLSGDTVDASFKDMFVYSRSYNYGGYRTLQYYGTSAVEKSADLSNNPRGNYIYNEQGETWRLHGTASIPGGGNWDSYPEVGVRVFYNFGSR